MLFHKNNITLQGMKKSSGQLGPTISKKRKHEEPAIVDMEIEGFTAEELQASEYIKACPDENLSEILDKWKLSSRYRLYDIRFIKKNVSLDQILDIYSSYSRLTLMLYDSTLIFLSISRRLIGESSGG